MATTRGSGMRVQSDRGAANTLEGGSVLFATGRARKEWRDAKKENHEAAEQKFPGQRGCRIIFLERFEMLHCSKLKGCRTEFSVMTLRTDGTLGGRINRQETKTNPKTLEDGRWHCTSKPRL